MPKKALILNQLEIGHPGKGGMYQSLIPPARLSLGEASLAALAGTNGAGKTTLLKTIAGIHPPVSGEIEIFGMQLNKMSRLELARQISVVLTDITDDFYLRTEDIVAMGRYPHLGFWGKLKSLDREIVEDCMQLCGVEHLKGRRLVSLSDGERQKIFIAKALAQDTPLIIMDEPSAFLDYPGKLELMTLLRRLVGEQQKTILFSSHDLELVMRFADQLWLMSPAKPLIGGSPEALATSGKIGEYFDRNKLAFDLLTGKFQLDGHKGRQVFLSPDLLHHNWLTNALLRNGFDIGGKDAAFFSIHMHEGNYHLKAGDKDYFCPGIDALIIKILSLCQEVSSI